MAKLSVAVGLSIGALALAPRAHADAGPEDRAAADALYQEAGTLMKAARFGEACPKLETSERLDPAIGTLLRLAYCLEQIGRTASSWSAYNDAEGMARKANDKRADIAAAGAKALEPKLSKVLLDVAPETRGPGVEMHRDGHPLDAGLWSSPVPIDPGQHTLDVTRPGKQPWKTTFVIAPGPGVTTVQVPALADSPAAPPSGDTSPTPYWSAQRIGGVVVAGTGLVATVIGAVFGARAISKEALSNQTCHAAGSGDVCKAPGLAARQAAGTAATVSDVTLGVGVAALACGAALFFTAPAATSRRPPRRRVRRAPPLRGSASGRWGRQARGSS